MIAFITLILICTLSFILRLPSFNFPLDYDVGGSLFNGMVVAEKGFYTVSHGLRPFGSLAIYALIYKIFGSSTVWINISGAFFWIFSTLILYKLTLIIFKNKRIALFTSLVFIFLNSSRALQGEMTNLETLFIPFVLLALCFYFSDQEARKKIYLFSSGLFFGIAFLIKHSAIFDFLAIFLFATYSLFFLKKPLKTKSRLKIFFSKGLLLGSGFLFSVLLVGIYFLSSSKLSEFIYWQFFSLFNNVSQYQSFGNALANFRNSFSFIFSKTHFFWLLSFWGIILTFTTKDKPARIFLLCWLLTVFSGIYYLWWFFPHHFLQLVPPISIFAGLFLNDLLILGKKEWDKSQLMLKKRLIGLIFFLGILLTLQADSIYFVGFLENITGKIEQEEYLARAGFDVGPGGWLSFYEAADYIKEKAEAEDKIFIWASTPVIYALAEKQPLYWAVYKYAFLPKELKPPTFWTWFPETNKLKKELMETLKREYPEYILIRVDPEKIFYEMVVFPEFSDFIVNNYLLDHVSGNILVYKNKGEKLKISETKVIPLDIVTRFAAVTTVEKDNKNTVITLEPMINPGGILQSFKITYPGTITINFEPITLEFLGQDGNDLVGINSRKPSGIIDLHFKIKGIRKPISFIRVKMEEIIWLNRNYGVSPILKAIKAADALDLFLEPPQDWQNKLFSVYLIYKDGSASQAEIKSNL